MKKTIFLLMLLSGVSLADTIPQLDIEKARKEAQETMDKVIKSKTIAPATQMDISKIPQPSIPYKGNIASNAKKYGQELIDLSKSKQQIVKIKVFLSWSIPEGSLDRYLDEADKLGSRKIEFAFIGMDETNSLPKNAARIRKLAGERNVAVEIDPKAFEQYEIKTVPTLIVFEDNPAFAAKCNSTVEMKQLEEFKKSYIGVAGDVSIALALNHLQKAYPDNKFKDFIKNSLSIIDPKTSDY